MKPNEPSRANSLPMQESRLLRQAPRDVAVLIPAYRPTDALIDLTDRLSDAGCPAIILVDDGTPARYEPMFELLAQNPRVHLMRHPANLGKGSALKTGMRYFLSHLRHYRGIVTADADGQHAPDDVIRIARALHRSPRLAIIGARSFDLPLYPGAHPELPPFRRLLGNRITSVLFRWITGVPLTDAQSGLRALPSGLLPRLVELPGTRYEYEMSVLLQIARAHHPLAEQPICTLYDPANPSSSFRPIRDSIRVLHALFRHDLPEDAARAHTREAVQSVADETHVSPPANSHARSK